MLPIIFLLVCTFLVLLPIYEEPYNTGIGVAIMLAGIPVYMVTVMWKTKPNLYRKFISKFTSVCGKRKPEFQTF